jgi:hypothetical protein
LGSIEYSTTSYIYAKKEPALHPTIEIFGILLLTAVVLHKVLILEHVLRPVQSLKPLPTVGWNG